MASRIADIKASMTGIKTRIRSEMTILAVNLQKNVSWRSLERALGRVGKDWAEVEKHYTNILSLMVNDEDEGERDAHL